MTPYIAPRGVKHTQQLLSRLAQYGVVAKQFTINELRAPAVRDGEELEWEMPQVSGPTRRMFQLGQPQVRWGEGSRS